MPPVRTEFLDPGTLNDDTISLRVRKLAPANEVLRFAPAYHFNIISLQTDQVAGEISLRLGNTWFLEMYAGQIAYSVLSEHQGHRYAARACRLVLPLAHAHGIDSLWITCNPDNLASKRTCEIAGGELVEIVDLPSDCDMYHRGERQKCRFRFVTATSGR